MSRKHYEKKTSNTVSPWNVDFCCTWSEHAVEGGLCCPWNLSIFYKICYCFSTGLTHLFCYITNKLMTHPLGNSVFCFPQIPMFPSTLSQETLRFSETKTHCSTQGQSWSVKCWLLIDQILHEWIVNLDYTRSSKKQN